MDEVHEYFDSIYVLKLADLAWSLVLKDDFYGNFGLRKTSFHIDGILNFVWEFR